MTISSLIRAGYVADDILSAISKKNVSAGRKIGRALALGYSASTILSKLTGGQGRDENYKTSEQKTREGIKKQKRNAQIGLGLGALALAGGGAALASGLGRSVASAGLANAGGSVAQATGAATGTQEIAPIVTQAATNANLYQTAQGASAAKNPAATAQHAVSQLIQPDQSVQGIATESIPQFDYYKTETAKKYPYLTTFIENHKKLGKTPEETHDILKRSKFVSPISERFEKETGKPISEAITQIYRKPEEEIAKNDIVISPFGAGEIHKTHKGDAYVKVDDKLRKIPESELEQPQPNVIEAVNNILKIPEIDRSSNVALFLYDPTESKAIFQFHDGSAYKYLDIDPEVVRKIAEKEATPITQGENTYGAWSPEDKHGSLGAALWAYVLKDPKYKKALKGQTANPNYMKLETLYDYWVKLRKKRGL